MNTVVVTVTGHGLKDPDWASKRRAWVAQSSQKRLEQPLTRWLESWDWSAKSEDSKPLKSQQLLRTLVPGFDTLGMALSFYDSYEAEVVFFGSRNFQFRVRGVGGHSPR